MRSTEQPPKDCFNTTEIEFVDKDLDSSTPEYKLYLSSSSSKKGSNTTSRICEPKFKLLKYRDSQKKRQNCKPLNWRKFKVETVSTK